MKNIIYFISISILIIWTNLIKLPFLIIHPLHFNLIQFQRLYQYSSLIKYKPFTIFYLFLFFSAITYTTCLISQVAQQIKHNEKMLIFIRVFMMV